jgi:hypothetical protein
MKKWLLLSVILGAMPLTMMAQDDDMYFVPTKENVAKSREVYNIPRNTYYSGSNRSIDEYNRRGSYYEPMATDSLGDIIDFSAVKGVYPDSVMADDYQLTRQMSRFDDYQPSNSSAYWAGYSAGRNDYWGWHSPWYYSSYYPWYTGWYDPWYYDYGWYGGWYDPWYYGYSWYRPYYYSSWYGGYYGRPYYYHGGYVSRPLHRDSGRNSFGANSSRGSFGASRAATNTSGTRSTFGASRSRTTTPVYRSSGNSFGASQPVSSGSSFGASRSSSSGGSYSSGGGSSSGGGFGASGGGGGGGRSSGGGGGGGFGRHR